MRTPTTPAVLALLAVSLLSGCGVHATAMSPDPPTGTAEPVTSRPVTPGPVTPGPVTPGSPDETAELAQLPVLAPDELVGGYARKAFGETWADVDQNGCNQRDDVLVRDADPASLRVARQGSCDHDVLAGSWRDPYTGRLLSFTNLKDQDQAQAIQIDHVVSLSEAWATGAAAWTPEQRLAFANDLDNLRAVDGPTNEAKSDAGPTRWLPEVGRCEYVEHYVAVKAEYRLGVTASTLGWLQDFLAGCQAG